MFRPTPEHEATILNCLRVAAERFEEHAKEFTQLADMPRPPLPPPTVDEQGVTCITIGPPTPSACRMLATQFTHQASEASMLADAIEAADGFAEPDAPRTRLRADPRERDTILAALRYWQREGLRGDPRAELAIASEHGDALSLDEVDSLCERINR